MENFDRDVSLPAYAKGFVKRLHNRVALIAHMTGIDAAVTRGDFREFYQLFGLCVKRRSVNQRSAETDSAVLHRLSDELFHLFQFSRSGRAVLVFQYALSHLCSPHISCD